MILGARLRRTALTVHVTTSVGWLGAVGAFLALAVAGLSSESPQTVRAVYVAMEVMGWGVLVPLSLASFASGVVQSLGTKWGLMRHYWVVTKLSITVIATAVLLLYTRTLESLADTALAPEPAAGIPAGLPSGSPLLHAGVALILLLVTTVLAVFKPRGVTRYGLRKLKRAG